MTKSCPKSYGVTYNWVIK